MILIIVICFALIVLSEQPALMFISITSLYFTYSLFWKRYEPNVIFFGLFLTWLTITIKIFYSDIFGYKYIELSSSPNIIYTTYLSLIGYCFFAFGLWFALKKFTLSNKKLQSLFTDQVNFRRILIVYLVVAVLNALLKGFIFYLPGFSQLFVGLLQMKLGFLFLLLFYSFKQRKNLLIVFCIILIEIIFSFFSYFSNFKDIIITAIVIISLFPNRLSIRESIISVILGLSFLYSIFIWQSVKGEYRQYLNAGQYSQQIVVSQEDALIKLQELSTGKSKYNKNDIFYETVDRISSLEFFSQSIDNVPSKISYENGSILKSNILHIVQPRIFFPNKTEIDDSKLVNKYATRKVSTAKQGTTFSLGFMAESYIDFGPILMFVPIFFTGWLMGFIYKQIIEQSINYMWGFTLVSSLWININCNGIAGSKILGWVLMYYIVFLIFRYTLMKLLDRYIREI